MRTIFLVLALAVLLASTVQVQAEEFASSPPRWEVGEHWTYRSREVRGNRESISTFDIWVARLGTLGGRPVYYVETLEGLRWVHPAVIATTIWRYEPRRVWTVFDQALTPFAWVDPVLSAPDVPQNLIFVSVEGWKLFDWPLVSGKRWHGRAVSRIGESIVTDEYEAHVSAETVTVAAGTYETRVVTHRGRLTQNGATLRYEQRTWYAPAAKGIVKILLKLQSGGTLEVELRRGPWRY